MLPIFPERAVDTPAVEVLLDRAFGPDRRQKTVYRLREDTSPIAELCFLSYGGAGVDGSIRFWPVEVAGRGALPALLLGPVAVAVERRSQGLGRALVRHGLAAARQLGHGAVILVGDPSYYGQFGFERRLTVSLSLPGAVDPERFLGLELRPGALAGAAGAVLPSWRCLRAA